MEILKRNFIPERIIKDYSKVAWFYDFWSLLTESQAAKKVMELAKINNGETILEVAVGTGALFEKIVLKNQAGLSEGIDISPRMLKYAKGKLQKNNLQNYHLKESNAYHLKFDNNYFDLLINNYMLDLMPEEDFMKILGEFYRVIKPGGRIIISSMSTGENWNNKLWFGISKNLPGLMTNCRPINLKNFLTECKFKNLESVQVTQFTFPSEVIKAEKIK